MSNDENINNTFYSISVKLNSKERLLLYELIENKNDKIKRLNNTINEIKLCNSDYYNTINTLSSKIAKIRELCFYELTNVKSLQSDILEIIDNHHIILGSDKE